MLIKLILLISLVIIYGNPKIISDDKIKLLSIVLFIIVLTMPDYKLFFEGFRSINKDKKE